MRSRECSTLEFGDPLELFVRQGVADQHAVAARVFRLEQHGVGAPEQLVEGLSVAGVDDAEARARGRRSGRSPGS